MGGLLADDLQDGGRAEVKLVEQKVVWVPCFQPQRTERGRGEVGEVRGDDGLRATFDRRREYVPVVFVGKSETGF